jgi:hypothetical protein
MAGLYRAIPSGSDTANHGLDLEGSPGNNGLWFIITSSEPFASTD